MKKTHLGKNCYNSRLRHRVGKIKNLVSGAKDDMEEKSINPSFDRDSRIGEKSEICPETVIVFTTFGRETVSKNSFKSLMDAIKNFRRRVKVVVSDATPSAEKATFFQENGADDVIWSPNFASAATQRNLCLELIQDKYSNEFICLVEDDYEYTEEWYPRLVDVCRNFFGRLSPWGMPYGMFSASNHVFQEERQLWDREAELIATFHGTVADQRFMPMAHYLNILRFWDPDVLGVSLCQTGMQTSRHAMRGFCGGVIPSEDLCWEIPEQESTWRGGKRDVGPAAHSMKPQDYKAVIERVQKFKSFPDS